VAGKERLLAPRFTKGHKQGEDRLDPSSRLVGRGQAFENLGLDKKKPWARLIDVMGRGGALRPRSGYVERRVSLVNSVGR